MSNFAYDNPQLWQVGTRSAILSPAATRERVAMPPTMDNAQPRAEHKTHRTRLQRTPAYFHTCSGGGYRVLSGGAVESIIVALQIRLSEKRLNT